MEPVPGAQQRPIISRTRSVISRFLLCGQVSSRTNSPIVDGAAHSISRPQTLRQNPHRRSTGQLTNGHTVRRAFPISALTLLVNVKRESVQWTEEKGLMVSIDALSSAKVSITGNKKGALITELNIEPGMDQLVAFKLNKPGVYYLKVTAQCHGLADDSTIIKCQSTEVELHKGSSTLIPRVIGQSVEVDGGSQYSLLEIYGRPTAKSASAASIGSVESIGGIGHTDSNDCKECVVCMTLDRDTIVLPCRHLCVCAGCAEDMRSKMDKCPICRECCQGLLQVKLLTESDQEDFDVD